MKQYKLFYTNVRYGGVTQHYYFDGTWFNGLMQYTASPNDNAKPYTLSKETLETLIKNEPTT